MKSLAFGEGFHYTLSLSESYSSSTSSSNICESDKILFAKE